MLRVDLMPGLQNKLRHGCVSHEAAAPFLLTTHKPVKTQQAKSCESLSLLIWFVVFAYFCQIF